VSLLDQGTRGDVPTGKTPRKRVWECPDQWELTEGRDNVLRAWRERGTSDSATKTELIPDEPDNPDMPVNVKPEFQHKFNSPLAASLASSTSSESVPIYLPVKVVNAKSNFDTHRDPGTLKDNTTNVVAEGQSAIDLLSSEGI
jgi:kinesin family member 11